MTTRRTAMLLATLASWPWLTGFGWPQFFDLSWDEEVQLHDGRVIVVHLKFTYERLSRLSRYDRVILRNSEMSFDAGPPHGRIKQLFRRQKPVFLDRKDGQWYLVLEERGARSLIRDEDWGPKQNSTGQWVGVLRDGRFTPTPLDLLPSEFDAPNMLYEYAPMEQIVKLDKTTLTLRQKTEYLRLYPLGPGDQHIDRPNPSVYEQIKQREQK